ncbi:uncharacterized protein HKW66_Vig0173360 [Vigna angularis]|uniref:Uncharacterized protein n=1 Tax=Phaseolus angularis TaxID=3914 RepID=A0A8T0JPD3_PHAAN|nr:uncharacterized protein HKW66_Vig0173360 [Vigna angularis]
MITRLLATKLYPEFIKIPVGRRRLLETTQAFEELTSLPNMCGAIDTTLVHLRSTPNNNPNLNPYRCHYGYPSLLLQVVSDHKKIFWDVCVKAPDDTDDATHFRDNLFYQRLTSGNVTSASLYCPFSSSRSPPTGWAPPLRTVRWNAHEGKVRGGGGHCASEGEVEDSSGFEHRCPSRPPNHRGLLRAIETIEDEMATVMAKATTTTTMTQLNGNRDH